jgi:prepilin-type N-terminal cleavage/methylation domain-containing protein
MRTKRHQKSGFSLIEMIVVLAIVAAILTTLAVSFAKRMDRLVSERETANLKKIAAAFKRSVEVNRYVPSETTWVDSVANQLGWQTNQVRLNERRIVRVLLIDPLMQVGTSSVGGPTLPYSQPIGGSTVTIITNGTPTVVRPPSPRFMILSTVSSSLPTGLVSGVGATNGANAFTNIWATAEGAIPAGWTFANGNDLKIVRIDLSDLFVPITIWNYDSARIPFYAVDGSTSNSVTYTWATPPPAYYIRGSELKLYGTSGDLQYSEVVYTGHDFLFELGAWTAKSFLGRSAGTPFGKDMQRALDLFLRAPANPRARSGATTAEVRNAMVAYMSAYTAWRDAGYPGESCPGPVANNSYTTALSTARVTLSNVSGDLINP